MAERGQYRSIRVALFDGKDFRLLPSDARWVFTLLKCNLNYSGISVRYRDELAHRIAGQSGLALNLVLTAIEQLEGSQWVRWEDNVIWIIGQLEYEPNVQPDNQLHRKGLLKHLSGLPRHALVAEFVQAHPDWCRQNELKKYGLEWAMHRVSNGHQYPIEASSKEKGESIKDKGVVEGSSSSTAGGIVFNSAVNAFPSLNTELQPSDAEMLASLCQRFHATSMGTMVKVIGEVAGALDGIHGERRTWPELRTNIGDFLINPDARPGMAALRGYLYRNPDTSARNGAKPTAGQRAFEAAGAALRGGT